MDGAGGKIRCFKWFKWFLFKLSTTNLTIVYVSFGLTRKYSRPMIIKQISILSRKPYSITICLFCALIKLYFEIIFV